MADIAKEYGKALYELAEEKKLQSEILGEVRAVRNILKANDDYILMLSSPSIKKDDRISSISKTFDGRINEYICSFIKLMTKRGYASYIIPCFDEYERLWYQRGGIAIADVRSAVMLSDTQKNALIRKLEAFTGKDIEMRLTVDESLIGGVTVMIDGKRLEGSVKANLDILSSKLTSKTI